jgi:uncharacterized spore protein YtfJ
LAAVESGPRHKEVVMPNIDELLAGARDAITVKRVYGDPIETEGVTVIPAAKVGGGGGGGGDSENNGGGGFGLGARPVGAYVIKGEDVKWVPAVDVNRLLAFAFVVSLAFALRR